MRIHRAHACSDFAAHLEIILKRTLIAATILALSFGASATVFGNTDSHDTYNQPQSHATGNGYGGQGGAGGAGGVAQAGAAAGAAVVGSGNSSATGGAVLGSGNSSVRNDNTNAQQQDQAQGQQQSSRNSNRNTATTGASTSSASSGGNSMQGGNVTVEGDSYEAARRSVATAYAAPLAASNGTCMGSSSVGGQGAVFGLSVGTTWTDGSCDIRYDAEALRAAGLPAAAQARLCQKPEIAKAMEAAGTPCPGAAAKTSATSTAPAARSAAAAPAPQYTDPIVRQRLGLPPL